MLKYRIVLGFCFFAAVTSCGSEQPQTPVPEPETPVTQAPPRPAGRPTALLVTDQGTIAIELLTEIAPKTVDNFIKLAGMGFYTRSTFHRVMAGTMIQGGDPNSKDNDPYNDGQGNSGSFLAAEFSSWPFERGTVAMARQEADPDSASSQFFIVLKRMPAWDRQYTVFGKVIEGIEVADRISGAPLSKDPRLNNHPAAKIYLKSVKVEYRTD